MQQNSATFSDSSTSTNSSHQRHESRKRNFVTRDISQRKSLCVISAPNALDGRLRLNLLHRGEAELRATCDAKQEIEKKIAAK